MLTVCVFVCGGEGVGPRFGVNGRENYEICSRLIRRKSKAFRFLD